MNLEEISRKITELDWLIQAYAISIEGSNEGLLVKKVRRCIRSMLNQLEGRIVIQRLLSAR